MLNRIIHTWQASPSKFWVVVIMMSLAGGVLCLIAVAGFYVLHVRSGARVAANPIEQTAPFALIGAALVIERNRRRSAL